MAKIAILIYNFDFQMKLVIYSKSQKVYNICDFV